VNSRYSKNRNVFAKSSDIWETRSTYVVLSDISLIEFEKPMPDRSCSLESEVHEFDRLADSGHPGSSFPDPDAAGRGPSDHVGFGGAGDARWDIPLISSMNTVLLGKPAGQPLDRLIRSPLPGEQAAGSTRPKIRCSNCAGRLGVKPDVRCGASSCFSDPGLATANALNGAATARAHGRGSAWRPFHDWE
jgi:hypothetical protein